MATDRKGPRIRKTETVRERAEKAQAKADKPKPRRVRRAASKTAGAFGFLRIFKKPLRIITYPLRPLWWLLKKLFPKYFINSYRELRKVTWPGRRETWKLTFAVLVFATCFGFVIALVDFGLDKVIRRIVLR